jgi:branched-chain amino acid transport system permease protein
LDLSLYAYLGSTLVVYFFTYNILTWGLNIQFGYAGIPNFSYITFMAAGAYFTGVFGIGPPSSRYVHYILGLGWPFPLTLLGGAAVAALLGLLVGFIALNRLRSDHLAIVTFSLGFIAYDFVSSFVPLFNGTDGIAGITPPLINQLQLDFNTYSFFFMALSGVVMLIMWFLANRIYNSALGRTLRAIRDDVDVAEALGKNTFRFRMIAIGVGCFYAGVGGALVIEFVTAFNPSGFAAFETFSFWTAMLVGGRGNNLGNVLGVLIVLIVVVEGSRLVPIPLGQAVLVQDLRFIFLGIVLILILWFRPDGLLPEKKRRFYELPIGSAGK